MSSLRLRARSHTRSSFVAVVFCASLFAACGDDTTPPPEVDAGAVADARVDSGTPFDGGTPDMAMCADDDGDGHRSVACGGDDCDDANAARNPTASEVCNGGIDDDCDGLADAACVLCPAGYTAPPSGGTCADIDECAAGICGAGIATCTNSVGSFACTCATGYTAAAASGAPCVDTDECATVTPCGAGRGSCANRGGTYACTCNAGYGATGATGGTGGTCSDLDECTLATEDCDDSPAATCANTDGSFTCACPPGFTGTGRGASGCDTVRFTALGDGTVRDNNGSGLEWQQGFSLGRQDQAASITYCTTLALDGGGWRLPTLDELLSIVDTSRFNPSIDTSFFPGTPSESFWSSSPVAPPAGRGWGVGFSFGVAINSPVFFEYKARCVR